MCRVTLCTYMERQSGTLPKSRPCDFGAVSPGFRPGLFVVGGATVGGGETFDKKPPAGAGGLRDPQHPVHHALPGSPNDPVSPGFRPGLFVVGLWGGVCGAVMAT